MKSEAARPLLFLDSGIGGLTIADEARQALPYHQQIYVADYAGYPYGTKSESEIVAHLPILLGKLAERYNPFIITIACNTASTIALDAVRQMVDIPIVGTVPAIKPAAQMTRTNIIGVLGTRATIRQPYVANLASQFAPNAHIIHHDGSDLVPFAEAKLRGQKPDIEDLRRVLSPMMQSPHFSDMDVLVLSCTHFPLLHEELAALLPKGCQLIDGAKGIARRITTLLERSGARIKADNEKNVQHQFLTTGKLSALCDYSLALHSRGFVHHEHFA
jgi:glutamate racemase